MFISTGVGKEPRVTPNWILLFPETGGVTGGVTGSGEGGGGGTTGGATGDKVGPIDSFSSSSSERIERIDARDDNGCSARCHSEKAELLPFSA